MNRILRYTLAIFLPWLSLLIQHKFFSGIICFILQIIIFYLSTKYSNDFIIGIWGLMLWAIVSLSIYYRAQDEKAFNKAKDEEIQLEEDIKNINELIKQERLQEIESSNELQIQRVDKAILNNQEYIKKFVLIAEPRVFTRDEYNDELLDEDAMTEEIDKVHHKICIKEHLYFKDEIEYEDVFYTGVRSKLKEYLELYLIKYHKRGNSKKFADVNFDKMSGTDFEIFLKDVLSKKGYIVIHIGKTGDQGADLITDFDGKKIVIQAKCYSQKISNDAVQEVIGAIGFHEANLGFVITNSDFTKSAQALAKKNNIKLINGNMLRRLINDAEFDLESVI